MQFTKQQACRYNAAKSFSMVKLAAGVYIESQKLNPLKEIPTVTDCIR